jgi:hypothetical protein
LSQRAATTNASNPSLAARLDAEYLSFRVLTDMADTLVFALGEAEVVRTRWRPGPDGWHASPMVMMHPDGARRELERIR